MCTFENGEKQKTVAMTSWQVYRQGMYRLKRKNVRSEWLLLMCLIYFMVCLVAVPFCNTLSWRENISSQEPTIILVHTKNHNLYPDSTFWSCAEIRFTFLASTICQIQWKVSESRAFPIGPDQMWRFLVLTKGLQPLAWESNKWWRY